MDSQSRPDKKKRSKENLSAISRMVRQDLEPFFIDHFDKKKGIKTRVPLSDSHSITLSVIARNLLCPLLVRINEEEKTIIPIVISVANGQNLKPLDPSLFVIYYLLGDKLHASPVNKIEILEREYRDPRENSIKRKITL